MHDDFESDDYEVGYGKPPKSGRFKKGFSGNPAGRPKGARDFDFESELVRQLHSKLTINENGKPKVVTKYELIARQLANKAASGSFRETRLLIALLPQALEKVAKLNQPVDVRDLTDDELKAIILRGEAFLDAQEGSGDRKRRNRSKSKE